MSVFDEPAEEPDQIRDQLRQLLRYRALLVLGLVLGMLGGAAVSLLGGSTYTATGEVVVHAISTAPFEAGGVSVDKQISMGTERQIAQSASVAAGAAKALKLDTDPATLQRDLRVSNPPETQTLMFEYSADTADRASALVNAFVHAYLDYRQDAATQRIDKTVSKLGEELKPLQEQRKVLDRRIAGASGSGRATDESERSNLVSEIADLQGRISSLKSLDTTPGDIVRKGDPPAFPSSPGLVVLLLAGAVIGLVLGILAAWVRSVLEPRVRSVADVQDNLRAPVLGILPRRQGGTELLEVGRSGRGNRAEAYRTIAFRLVHDQRFAGRGSLLIVAPGRTRTPCRSRSTWPVRSPRSATTSCWSRPICAPPARPAAAGAPRPRPSGAGQLGGRRTARRGRGRRRAVRSAARPGGPQPGAHAVLSAVRPAARHSVRAERERRGHHGAAALACGRAGRRQAGRGRRGGVRYERGAPGRSGPGVGADHHGRRAHPGRRPGQGQPRAVAAPADGRRAHPPQARPEPRPRRRGTAAAAARPAAARRRPRAGDQRAPGHRHHLAAQVTAIRPAGSGRPAPTAPGPAEGGGRGVATTARGSLFGLAGSAANALFGFVLVAVVTHGLGARGAGAVFTGVAAFTILSNTLKLGADTALVRFVSRDLELSGGGGVPGLLRISVLPTLLASTAGAAALLFSPGLAGLLLPDLAPGEAASLIRLFAVFLPVTTVALVLLGATRGYGSVVPFVGVEQIGKPALRVLLAVPLVLLTPSVGALSAAWLVPGCWVR
ncbi:hypothetical protein O1L68_38705 [Streptomyces lydicus]|nr:hypothetical protein [Streptomyces lydicus]